VMAKFDMSKPGRQPAFVVWPYDVRKCRSWDGHRKLTCYEVFEVAGDLCVSVHRAYLEAAAEANRLNAAASRAATSIRAP